MRLNQINMLLRQKGQNSGFSHSLVVELTGKRSRFFPAAHRSRSAQVPPESEGGMPRLKQQWSLAKWRLNFLYAVGRRMPLGEEVANDRTRCVPAGSHQ